MPRTTTTTRKPTTAAKRPKLVNDGRPRSKGGKGGVVTQHGVTTTGYQRGCRCDECRAAAVAYKRELREHKRQAKKKATKKTATKTRTTTAKTRTTTRRRWAKATS
jgi:hypothetical protein